MKLSLKDLIACGIFASIIAVVAQISIVVPFSPIPFTMQVFGVCLVAVILGAKKGFITLMVYILLGAIGVPVFAAYSSGPTVLFGKTGGFILAFPLMALLIGYVSEKFKRIHYVLGAMILSLMLCYAIGTIYFSFITKIPVQKAVFFTVIPYIPLDIVKVIMASLIGVQVRKRLSLGVI